MESVAAFISELIRTANETDRLTDQEKARLLQRAASTISGYRELVAYSETSANDGVQGDIVFELNSMASAVDLFPSERISAMLIEAVEVIKACQILLEEKRRIEKDRGEPNWLNNCHSRSRRCSIAANTISNTLPTSSSMSSTEMPTLAASASSRSTISLTET